MINQLSPPEPSAPPPGSRSESSSSRTIPLRFKQSPATHDVPRAGESEPFAAGKAIFLGGYELFGEIARGGMGIVYKARQRNLNRIVALKVTQAGQHTSAKEKQRFRFEAETAARLDHPNIVPIYEVGEDNGFYYYSMALVPGESLARMVATGPLPPRRAAELVKQVADAVAYAHSQGVIHRDLKPGNILLDADGQPRVTDFGLAKSVETDSGLSQTGLVVGTPGFMPPEQVEGKTGLVGPCADVYSLGATLYCLLTGRPPFQAATSLETLKQIVERDPVPPRQLNPAVDRDLDTICLKCLEKRPEGRYASATALAEDLQRFLDHKPILARPIGSLEKLGRWCRRDPLVAGLTAGVVATFLTAFFLVLGSYRRVERALQEEVKQRQEAQRSEQGERWQRYRANIIAGASALQLRNVAAARQALDDAPVEHRNWEWNYFHHQVDGSHHVLRGLDDVGVRALITPKSNRVVMWFVKRVLQVWDVAEQRMVREFRQDDMEIPTFSSDGKLIAYIARDHSVKLEEVDTGRIRFVYPSQNKQNNPIRWFCFTPDSTRLIGVSDEQPAPVWDTATGQILQLVRGKHARVDYVHSDGRQAVCKFDGDHAVRLWDLASGSETGVLHVQNKRFWGHRLNRQGDRLLTVELYPSNEMQLWEVATGKLVAELRGHRNDVLSQRFSSDGRRMATCAREPIARLWDGRTGAPVAALEGHTGWVYEVEFSPDGKRLVTASQDHTVRLWDAADGSLLAVLQGHTSEVFRAGFSPDGTTIVSASRDGTVRLWDARMVERAGVLRGHKSYVYGVAFHPDGEQVASSAWDGTIRFWEASTGRQTGQLSYGDDKAVVAAVAYHPGGKLLASVGRENGVRLWDLTTHKEVHRWHMPTHPWLDARLAFSPRGDLLAAGGGDHAVHVWDVANRAEVAVLRGHKDVIGDVAFSPDGRWLASASENEDRVVRIWDLATMTQAQVLTGHTFGVHAVAFSADGKWLASGSTDGTARLWDTGTWETQAILKHGANVYGLAFTPDNTRLASACADNAIRFWDVRTHQQVAELRGHKDYVYALAFSPDGTRLASASGDFTLRVWDVFSAQERARSEKR